MPSSKPATHTVRFDAIAWKILSRLSSERPESKPLVHGNALQLTTVQSRFPCELKKKA